MSKNTGPKRTKFQREQDLEYIARLYLAGSTQRRIAELLGAEREYQLSQQQISNDLREVQRRWQESSLRDFDQLKAQELAKIDDLERTYREAWEVSTKPRKRQKSGRVVRSGDGQGDKTSPERDTAELVTEDQVGNPKFLEGIQWCIERRCSILGLDSPTKIAPTDPSGRKPYRLTATERESKLREFLAGVMERQKIKS